MCGSSPGDHESTDIRPERTQDRDLTPTTTPMIDPVESDSACGLTEVTSGSSDAASKDVNQPTDVEDDDGVLQLLDTPPMGIDLDAEPPDPITELPLPTPAQSEENRGNDGLVTADEKEALMRKLNCVSTGDQAPGDSAGREAVPKASKSDGPAASPTILSAGATLSPQDRIANLPSPKMAGRGRGVAYFWRNFIQLSGHPGLRTKDELVVNDRAYELRPRTIDRRWVVTAAAASLTLLLVFIGAQLVSSGVDGRGSIMGIVLDEQGHPFLLGAKIRLPESGKEVTSNAQGFFVCSEVALGAHKIEYMIDGNLVASEFATVVDDEITTIFLAPATETQAEPDDTPATDARQDLSDAGAPAAGGSSTKSPEAPRSKSSKTQWSKVTLAANVEQARLMMDGEVLGAGNVTYAKLLPGKHTYTVSADGYQEVRGTIELKANQNTNLEVALTRLANSTKEITYSAEDFYYSGKNAVAGGDFERAIEDFAQAISAKPSFADAYEGRAEAYLAINSVQPAHDDFIRAAEIHRFRKNYAAAITAYNHAIKCDEHSLTGFLGRADLYLAQNQEIAAIADYDAAKEIDNNNARAHFGLGEARFQQGNYKRAIQHFKEARSLDGSNPLIHQYLMLAYLAADEMDDVRKAYENFVDVATPEQVARMKSDGKYSAVMRVVENN
ncbi:MAG: tetratricopeptide repeat protein [bacterium]